MISKDKILFIIIGDKQCGKATLQKALIDKLSGTSYDRFQVNLKLPVSAKNIHSRYQHAFYSMRSFQEKIDEYETVFGYFNYYFTPSDVVFISSEPLKTHVRQIIQNSRDRDYYTIGLFITAGIENNPAKYALVSALDWDEVFVFNNPLKGKTEHIKTQLNSVSDAIINILAKY